MSCMTDHMCKSILYKNLSSPQFKDYYTLDEINEELIEYENITIEPYGEDGLTVTGVRFHVDYRSFLFTLNRLFEDTSDKSTADRIYRFMELSMVK